MVQYFDFFLEVLLLLTSKKLFRVLFISAEIFESLHIRIRS